MPLHVTDFTWTQTDSEVHIRVPLKGAKTGNVDVVSTDDYLKVHFPPYLFEAFLFQPVDDERSSAKIGNGVAVFSLPKRTEGLWERLVLNSGRKFQKLSAESKQKAEKQEAEKKYALQAAMKWLRKQAEARRAAGADVNELKDLTEDERNPEWLKERGE
uniref:Dynein axonemal assembly factor 4 n=1 Tax=Kryptolebias marmoratus TaxID=37003 RepID=A0A3Q3BGG2_KRYMA